MSYPTQYTRPHSTLRRICSAIDDHGPLDLEELQQVLSLTYFPIRRWALRAAADGYLVVTKKKIAGQAGRPRLIFSRVPAELPQPADAPVNPKRRHRRTKPIVIPKWDDLTNAFFGAAA